MSVEMAGCRDIRQRQGASTRRASALLFVAMLMTLLLLPPTVDAQTFAVEGIALGQRFPETRDAQATALVQRFAHRQRHEVRRPDGRVALVVHRYRDVDDDPNSKQGELTIVTDAAQRVVMVSRWTAPGQFAPRSVDTLLAEAVREYGSPSAARSRAVLYVLIRDTSGRRLTPADGTEAALEAMLERCMPDALLDLTNFFGRPALPTLNANCGDFAVVDIGACPHDGAPETLVACHFASVGDLAGLRRAAVGR